MRIFVDWPNQTSLPCIISPNDKVSSLIEMINFANVQQKKILILKENLVLDPCESFIKYNIDEGAHFQVHFVNNPNYENPNFPHSFENMFQDINSTNANLSSNYSENISSFEDDESDDDFLDIDNYNIFDYEGDDEKVFEEKLRLKDLVFRSIEYRHSPQEIMEYIKAGLSDSDYSDAENEYTDNEDASKSGYSRKYHETKICPNSTELCDKPLPVMWNFLDNCDNDEAGYENKSLPPLLQTPEDEAKQVTSKFKCIDC